MRVNLRRSGRVRVFRLMLGLVLLVFSVLAGVGVLSLLNRPVEVAAYPANRVLHSASIDGIQYRLADDGNVFRVIDQRGTWTWVDRVFDPQAMNRDYIMEDGKHFIVDPDSGKRYPTLKHFEEGFEDLPTGVEGLRALIGETRMWTEFTLQTPKTPSIRDYVSLRNRIVKENADFLDATIEPSTLHAHSGKQSLRFVCPAKSKNMICAKSSIANGLFYFEQGDDIWFQACYRIEGATRPFTLADIEGRQVKESPGIRLMLFPEGDLGVELKAFDKPTYRQTTNPRVSFPVDRWVKVTWHLRLDPVQGTVQVWQDDQLIVDAKGQTLPFGGMVLNSVEVGISAHSFGRLPTTLFVDDLVVSDHQP